MDLQLKSPWMVAVWPGMGGIAEIAGRYLVHQLQARRVVQLSSKPYFDLRAVKISAGLVRPAALPGHNLFAWKNPGEGHDVVVFIGDEQPAQGGDRLCEELVELAQEIGVTRVFTFAAMASQIRPEAMPRVLGAATETELLDELRQHDVVILDEAEVSGLNGVVLAAAAERGLEGACLLGEFPFFASSIANPKASIAVLRSFASLAGFELDLTSLEKQASHMERLLTDNLNRMERAAARLTASNSTPTEKLPVPESWPETDALGVEARARIEALFKEAERDRSKAVELKAELDRHGVFEEFEDRFLDLFRKAD